MMNNISVESLDKVADLYIRVSTTEQAEEGYSVEEQEKKLRHYCGAMGFIINNVCVDPGISGATMDRPGLKALIHDVESGKCKKILVWKLDRLSRSQKDTLILLEDVFLANNCDFISLMESFDTSTPFGRCIVGILAAFAQMERDNIRIRTTMGRIAKVRKGHFGGSHAPIGYKFKENCNELLVDPFTSLMVKDAFRIFLEGTGISATGRMIAAKYGTSSYDWNNNTSVRRVLSNPVYMGKVRHKGELFDGIHKALINENDWYVVNSMLEHNRKVSKRTYKYSVDGMGHADNLLTGLLFCGDCGARMYARRVSKNNKKYVCHSVARTSPAMIKSDHCTNRLHPFTVKQLDNMVIDEVRKLSLDKSYFESIAHEYSSKDPKDEVSAFQERLEEIEKQITRLLNLYQTGLVSLDDVGERIGSLKNEKERLQQNLIKCNDVKTCSLDMTWDSIKDFSAVLDSGDMVAVQCLIHSLIDKIVVLNTDIEIYWSFC